MRVTLVSMPRCYTKSIVEAIGETLTNPSRVIYPVGEIREFPNLGELLQFNWESTVGVNDECRPVKATSTTKHLTASLIGNDFHYEFSERKNTVNKSRLAEVQTQLAGLSSWVVKVFPLDWMYEPLTLSYAEVCENLCHLRSISDVIFAVHRKDLRALARSKLLGDSYGYRGVQTVWAEPSQEEITNKLLDVHIETDNFRTLVSALNIPFFWSEDFAADPERVSKELGLPTIYTLPKNLEFSK
jgi:hypothetical protein